ncbi:hypothetical protein INT45_013976, partial [Circinella minor]
MTLKYELFGWKKTTASHIIDTCSKDSWKLLKQEFKETDLLKEIIDHYVLLPRGLPSECRAMFENIIKKLELRQSPEQIDDESLQVLDVISAIIMNLPETESKVKVLIPGENTFYTDVCGEQVCQASKEIIKNNKRFGIFKNNDKVESYGRNAGYLFYVSKFDDAYVAKETHTLGIPSTLNELVTFYDKLDGLYIWKHHNQRLVNIIESSLERCKGQESVERIITTKLDEGDESDSDNDGEQDPDSLFRLEDDGIFEKSPNVLFTPPCSKRKVTLMLDYDTEHSNIEESD